MAWRAPGFDPLRSIGSGATGSVIVSRDSITGTEVAVKYLSKEVFRARGFAENFAHEMDILLHLEHPHLVQVYEYVEGPGTGAIAMELVHGTSLRALLANGPLEPPTACYVIKSALLGLSTAQRGGLVHRDFRPNNVLLTTDGISKVTDIGVALPARRRAAQPGDARYMSPEMRAAAPPSVASDVYAVATTLLECLTGRVPRPKNSTAVGVDASTIAAMSPAGLPGRIATFLAQGLAPQPERRFPDAGAMLDTFDVAVLDGYGPDWEDAGRAQLLRRLAPNRGATPPRRTGQRAAPAAIASPVRTALNPVEPARPEPDPPRQSVDKRPAPPISRPRSPVDAIAFYAPSSAAAARSAIAAAADESSAGDGDPDLGPAAPPMPPGTGRATGAGSGRRGRVRGQRTL